MATERKIIFTSRRLNLMVAAAEALCSLLFPFYWQSPCYFCGGLN